MARISDRTRISTNIDTPAVDTKKRVAAPYITPSQHNGHRPKTNKRNIDLIFEDANDHEEMGAQIRHSLFEPERKTTRDNIKSINRIRTN